MVLWKCFIESSKNVLHTVYTESSQELWKVSSSDPSARRRWWSSGSPAPVYPGATEPGSDRALTPSGQLFHSPVPPLCTLEPQNQDQMEPWPTADSLSTVLCPFLVFLEPHTAFLSLEIPAISKREAFFQTMLQISPSNRTKRWLGNTGCSC